MAASIVSSAVALRVLVAASVVSATGSSAGGAEGARGGARSSSATGSSPTALAVLAGASLAPASSSAEAAVGSAGAGLAAAALAGAVAGSSAAVSATGSVASGAAAAVLGASPLGAVPSGSACGSCAPWAWSAAGTVLGRARRLTGRCLGGRGRGVHRGVHGLGRRRVGGDGGHCLGHAVAYGFDRARRRIETAHGQRRHGRALGQRLGRLCRELLGCEFDRPAVGIHQITLPGVESLVVASPNVPTTGRACCSADSRPGGSRCSTFRRAFPRSARVPTGVSSC